MAEEYPSPVDLYRAEQRQEWTEAEYARLRAALEQKDKRIVDLEGNLAFLSAVQEQQAATIAAARALHANIVDADNDDVDAYWALVSDLGAALAPPAQAEEE